MINESSNYGVKMSLIQTDFGDHSHDYDGIKKRMTNTLPFLIEPGGLKIFKPPHNIISAMGLTPERERAAEEGGLKQWFIDTLQSLHGKKISFLVENTTIKDQACKNFGYWRFRLNPQDPIFDDYSYSGSSLTIECTRKNGRLKVLRAFLDTASRRPYETEGILEGTVCIIRDNQTHSFFLSKDDFDWLLRLPPRKKNLIPRLDAWNEYLEEHLKVIQNKIGWVAYRDLRRMNPTQAVLEISSEYYSDNAGKAFFPEEDVQLLRKEIPNDRRWRPGEDDEEPIRIGNISRDSRIKGLFQDSKKKGRIGKQPGEWIPITIDLIDKWIHADPDDPDDSGKQNSIRRDPLESLPSSGLLVNSVFSDELPLKLQQKAVSRLKNKSAANPRLEDFVFDMQEARTPFRDEEIDPDTLVEKKLNQNQREAVKRALNAPDICLIQGPPGTGKTTVIAELCNQVTLRGGKVLISSQSNLAVDNALSRLANLKHIRPIRLGFRTTEEGHDFLADNVVHRWFQGVKEKLDENLGKQKEIQQDLREFEDAIRAMKQLHVQYQDTGVHYRQLQEQASSTERDMEPILAEMEANKARLTDTKQNLDTIESILAEGLIEPSQIPLLFRRYPEIAGPLQEKIAALSPEDECPGIVDGDISRFLDLYSALYQINTNRKQSMARFDRLLEIVLQQNIENDQKEAELLQKRDSIQSRMVSTTDADVMQTLSQELLSVNKEINTLNNSGKKQLAIEWRDQLAGFDTVLDYYSRCTHDLTILTEEEKSLISNLRTSIAPDIRYKGVIQGLRNFTQRISDDLFGADKTITDTIQKRREVLLSEKRSFEDADHDLEKKLAEQKKCCQSLERDLNKALKQMNHHHDRFVQLYHTVQQYRVKYEFGVLEETETGSDLLQDTPFASFIQDRQDDLNAMKSRFRSVLEKEPHWQALQTEWVKKIEKSSKIDYEAIKDTYINFANVVGATCTETGKYKFWNGRVFDLVIIDEVSKATPPELLMPMLLGKQIVLVGDHHQLPPIFRLRQDELTFNEADDSDEIKKRLKKFEKLVTSSYFEEMFLKADESLKSRLTEQYRMHPTIMNLINQFYPPDYQLTCGIADPDTARQHPFTLPGKHGDLIAKNAHAIWIDTSQRPGKDRLVDNFEGKETGKYSSRYNTYEVEIISKILCSLNDQCTDPDTTCRDVAVISFYAGQVRKLKDMRNSLTQTGRLKNLRIRVGTVDEFQGMERPIVMVSLVSAPEKRNGSRRPTSFVKEFRRINVAFSRAQSMLVVVGASEVFHDVPVFVHYDDTSERKFPYRFMLEAAKDGIQGSSYVRGYEVNDSSI